MCGIQKWVMIKIDLLPLGADQTENCEPILIDMPGWTENTFGTKELG